MPALYRNRAGNISITTKTVKKNIQKLSKTLAKGSDFRVGPVQKQLTQDP